jgi:hypothetical protein
MRKLGILDAAIAGETTSGCRLNAIDGRRDCRCFQVQIV